jgi:hypothetical protein
MATVFVILISLLFASQCDFISACGITQWNTAQYNWQEKCKKDYNGAADGARCFFVPTDAATNYDGAWKVCANKNATLASVITSSEMHTIRGNFSANVNLWISMYRSVYSINEPAPGTVCTYARNTTYYYANSNTSSSDKLSLMNTWLRNRNCIGVGDDTITQGQCLFLWNGLIKFGDTACTENFKTLCQVSSPVQAFRRVDNVCVTETPLATYDVSEGGLEKCMDACRRHGELSGLPANVDWCRSFNLKGNKCELFTWWIEDKPSMVFQHDCQQDCAHYTYVNTVQ